MFQRNHSDSAKEIKENLDSGKLEDAKRMAHTIKGVAASLGTEKLQKIAGALEKGINEEKSDHYQGLLEDFTICLNKTLDSLKSPEQEEVEIKQKKPTKPSSRESL